MKPLEGKVKIAFALLLTLLLLIGIASYKNLLQLIENNRLATKNRVILKKLEIVLTKITDAETGQRGYIITGDERYLKPYHAAVATINQEIKELRKLIEDNPNQEQKLNALEPLIAEKLAGLNERIDLRKKKGFEAASQEVRTGKGRTVMDNIRKIISDMENEERNLLELKTTETEASAKRTVFGVIFGSSLAFLIVGIASFITHREVIKHKQSDEALQKAHDELGQKVIERTTQLDNTIKKLEKEVDERKQIEELLKKSETSLDSILSSIDDLIFVLDSEGRFTFFRSPSSMKLYVLPDKFMGEKHSDVMPPHINNLIVNALNKNKNGEVAEFDYWLEVAGENKCWSAKLSPLFLKSEFLGSVAVIREITKRKEIEEKLRTASNEWRITFDSTSDLIMLLDREMNIIKANLATAKFFNKPINEILGENCFQIFHGTDKPCDVCHLEKVEKTKKREESEVYLSERGIWLRISVDPIFDDKCNLTGSVHIIRDITERKRAEEKLNIYQDQLRSLASQLSLVEEKERRRIAIDLHDHISQTLALCKIKLGTLQKSASSNLTNPLEEIRNLIEQSIQYTRSLTFELSPPILYELGFEAAVEWLGEQILKKHGILFYFKDDRKPKPIGNETRIILFQVMRELLMNIAKHAHADKASISICKDGDSIRIHIEDDGVGFDVSKIDTSLNKTVGFGFFSIRERLNYIGGQIEIKSEPGHGTRVTVVAPLKIEK